MSEKVDIETTIDINLSPKKVSCCMQNGLAQLCPFCCNESKICIAKLHNGYCKFHKVVGDGK